jgi:CBS domain-containing protein
MKMTAIDETQVGDVMQHGVLTCQSETPVTTAARMMAEHRVHSIVVSDLDGVSERAWGIVTDVDVVRVALEDADQRTVGAIAGTELVTVAPEDPLEAAVRLMVEHDVTHVLVESGGRPIAVVSTLDVAELLAS